MLLGPGNILHYLLFWVGFSFWNDGLGDPRSKVGLLGSRYYYAKIKMKMIFPPII